MKKLKNILLQLPEYLLIGALFFYWVKDGELINPLIIAFIALLTLQVLTQHRVIGLLIPSVLILVCFYMLFALLSEFNEFPSFNAEAKALLFVGLGLFLSGLLISGVMFYKYFPHSSKV